MNISKQLTYLMGAGMKQNCLTIESLTSDSELFKSFFGGSTKFSNSKSVLFIKRQEKIRQESKI